MKRWVLAGGALVVLAVVVLWWRRTEAPRAAQAPGRSNSVGVRAAHDRSVVAAMPPGFGDVGASPRPIAGRVVANGAAYAGAQVVLTAELPVPDGERASAADGTFSFGARAPGTYQVAATAPGMVAAIVNVSLANPLARPDPEALELVLQPCTAWVVGEVRDVAGGPIQHARVLRDGVVGTETSDTGTYELCVPAGSVTIEYLADGYGAVSLTFPADLRTRRDVVLVPEAVVHGRVVDEHDAPVADAAVTVAPEDWAQERGAVRRALSDANGRFRIEQLQPGRVRLWALAAHHATVEPLEIDAEVGTPPEIVVRVVRRAALAGRVMQRGVPVVGVEVWAYRGTQRSPSAISQRDGSFVIARVPDGELTLSARGYRVVSPTRVPPKTTDVVVEVAREAIIRGTVTRNGAPIGGVEVCCVQRDMVGNSVRSEGDGSYVIDGVPAGTHQLWAQLPTAFADSQTVTITGDEEKVVNFELTHAGEIRGTVVDENGAPLRGMHVRFQHPTTGDLCRAVTDDSGAYRCAQLTGGAAYVAGVFPTASMVTPLPPAHGTPHPAVEVANGASKVTDVTLAVVHRRGTIRGRVVDGKGAGIADARVQASPEDQFHAWMALPSTVTDADGSFTLFELAGDSYSLQARTTTGAVGVAKAVAVGARPTIVVIQPGAIAGSLAGFSEPPAIYAAGSDLRRGTITGSAFRIANVEPGHYVVTTQTEFEGDLREVDVREGQTTTVDFVAKGRATIEAVIADWKTKAPVANMRCQVVMAAPGVTGLTNWNPAVSPRSDAAGVVRFSPAPAGHVAVRCMPQSGQLSPPSGEVTVAAGGSATLKLWTVSVPTQYWGFTGAQFEWNLTLPRITAITPASSAAEQGLAVGDVVVAVDDQPIVGLNSPGVLYLVNERPIGSKVPVTVARGAQRLRVVLDVRPPP